MSTHDPRDRVDYSQLLLSFYAANERERKCMWCVARRRRVFHIHFFVCNTANVHELSRTDDNNRCEKRLLVYYHDYTA